MFLAQTSGNFGESIQITGAGNQFFSISEVRVGGISGVAAQFEVPDKNTISFVVPSFSSLTGSGDRSNWVNYCHPNPILVFSEARNVSGYASGAHGEEKNFTPIPQINGFFPASGLSGDSVTVQGDAFFGLTGLSITNISGSPSGYTHLTGLSNVVTGVGFPGGTGSGFADEVYLDFTITNNTGLSFNLPSGNFDGNIKVYGSGSVSAISDNHVEPHLEITGFYPPVGITGSYVLISGQYFLDEIINNTSGIFSGLTGNTFGATGVLVAFNGDHASGCFTKINNNLISGLVPVSAKAGPVRIAKNINVLLNSGEIPYYQSSGVYCLETPAPETSGLASVGGEESFFGFYSLLETGSYNSGINSNSGISLTGASIANWKTGTAIFTPQVVGEGLYNQSISGGGGEISGPNINSQVTFIEENFIPMSDGTSPKNSLITFKGNNFYETGSCTATGEAFAPIVCYIPELGPDIDECLQHFNAGSGFLSGCEASYLIHFSGHHKNLNLESANFQPGLLQCFLTNQASERASIAQTGSSAKAATVFKPTGSEGIIIATASDGVGGGGETVVDEEMLMCYPDDVSGPYNIGGTTYQFLPSGHRLAYWLSQEGEAITVTYASDTNCEFVTVETVMGAANNDECDSGVAIDLLASNVNDWVEQDAGSGICSGTPSFVNEPFHVESTYISGTTFGLFPMSVMVDFYQKRPGMPITVSYETVSCATVVVDTVIGSVTGEGVFVDLKASDINRFPEPGFPNTCQNLTVTNSGGFFGFQQATCVTVSQTPAGGTTTINTSPPLVGTNGLNQSSTTLPELINESTPPNFDPLSESLAGNTSPSAGAGPSVLTTFPPNVTSRSAPNSLQINIYGQCAFETHLGGAGSISYPPAEGPIYTPKAKTDPSSISIWQNTDKSAYSNFPRIQYGVPTIASSNPETNNWTTLVVFNNGRQLSNLAGIVTPEQISNFEKNRNQIPGYSRIIYNNNPNRHGNQNTNLRTQTRGTNLIGGTTGPVSRTLNQNVNKGKNLGSLRRGALRFSTVPSSAYTGRPGHYKLSFNREALSPIPSSSIYGTQEASELAEYKKGIIGFMPGIEGLVKMGNKTSSFGGGSANGEIRSEWARQPIGGGGTPGNTVVDPPIQMIVSENVPPNFDPYASSLGTVGLQIPTSQTPKGIAGSPIAGGQHSVSSSPYVPGPTVHLGPFNAPQGIARTVTQNFPSTVPPHLYPPLGGPCGILPNPPITLYPRITPTRTEDMTNICASPCTAAHTGNTGWGIGVLADPEISGCAVNNCFQHCLKTGSSGYSYYEPVAQSMFAIKSSTNVPYQTTEVKRTGITYCSVAAADEPVIESTGVGRFGGGYLTTEASTELDLSAEDKWTVQFWAQFKDQHPNMQKEPHSGIDVALFGFSGENAAESGNTFFNIGFTREVVETGVLPTGDVNFDDVRLLLSVTGDDFDKSYRNLTGVNAGATNTSVVKFSTTPSYTFDGSDYILMQGVENQNASVTYPNIWSFNRESTDLIRPVPTKPFTQTSELTVEFFIKMPPLAATGSGIDTTIISARDFSISYDSGYGVGGSVSNGDSTFTSINQNIGLFNNANGNGSARIDDDNWHHIAFCKSGNNLKLFVNGVNSGNSTFENWNGLIGNRGIQDELYVGKDANQWMGEGLYVTSGLSGVIQELRISDIARYGADFSVPTEPYPTGYLNKDVYRTVNTVKPYTDLSGIQSSTNYYTGWFSDTGWHHFAFVKNGTGYSTYYDGDSVGLNVAAADYDCFMPSGHTKFYFGGLPTGRFGKFNTGFNQQFISGSDTDLLLHFNNNLLDSGRYNQTITSGGFPTFAIGADQKFGDYALNFTGIDYLQTSGKHFTYGTGDFTIECWLKPSGAILGETETGNAIQTVWALANQFGEFSTGNGLALMLNHSTNNLRLAFDSEIQQLQVDLVPPLFGNYLESGKWNHVAVTRENNIFYGFVNGDPAGAFGGRDFAEHESTKQFFTGTPTLDLTGQSLFIGGAVSGDLSMAFAPTGELYNTQPYRLQRDAESEHYSIEAGTDSCVFRRSIGKDSTLLNTGIGYSYTARTSGIIEITVETLSRWGGARMTSLGVSHSYAGVRFEHNGTAISADGTRSLVGLGENTIRWEIGGWEATRQSSNQSFIFGDLTDCEWAADGANDYVAPFVPSCDDPKGISMRGCEVKKTVNQIITGVNVGDQITLIANRYFNEGGPGVQVVTSNGTVIDNDLDNLYKRNTMGATEDPLASGPDILHIESMLIRENILCNYMGQIDEFRISSGVKYSNIPDTGSYASGFLNTDLGGLVYIDELNIKKDSLYGNLDANNGIEAVPVAAPATGYNFEVVLSSGDLITNGTVGDNEAQPLRTFLTDVSTSGGAMLTGSENGNAKFGNHSMIFPTGNTTSGAQNFLYKSGISFGTGDFLAEMWIKPSGFTYDTRVGIPGALYAINNTTNFYPQYYKDVDQQNEEGRTAFSKNGWAAINGAFNFRSSGLLTGDVSYMRVSGNQISGSLLPSLQWPETNPIISVPSGSFGDFSTNDFTIEFLFMSEDTANEQEKIFTWGPDCSCGDGPCLSWEINYGEVGNNYVFWDGCGETQGKYINFNFNLCDGKYHVCTLTRFGNIFAVYIDGQIRGTANDSSALDLGNSPLDIGLPYKGSSPTMNIAKFRVWKGLAVPQVFFNDYLPPAPRPGSLWLGPSSRNPANIYQINPTITGSYEVMPNSTDGIAHFAGPQYGPDGLIRNRNSSQEANPISNSFLKILDLEPEASIIPVGASAGVAEAQISQFKDSSSSNITLKNRGVHRYEGDSDNIKFGNSSMLFKINGAAGPFHNQPGIKIKEGTFDFGTSSDFTIECWVKGDNHEDFSLLSSAVTSQIIGSSKNWGAHMRGKKLQWYDGTNGFVPTSRTEASSMENSWVHVAIVRNGGNLSSYVDGVKIDHGANSFDVNDALNGTVIGPFYTDSNRVGVDELGLWVDQIRVSDNARYTAAFTPPSAAFTNDGNTKLLIDSDTLLSPSESQRVFDRSMIPSPSGITNASTITFPNPIEAKAPGSYANRQSLLSIGGYDRGFNFFLSGQTGTNDFNYLGLDLSNGPTLTGTEAQRIGDRYELFDKQGSSQYWVSGEWNHIALARINNNFQAYVNGNSAGKLNLFNTYYPSGQTDSAGRNIGLEQVLTGTTASSTFGGGTFIWDGYEYDLTSTRYHHGGDLSAAVANPRIVSDLGAGWSIADWNDFSTFTENAFVGLARQLGPKQATAPATCEGAIDRQAAGEYEWNLGWILAGGIGNWNNSYSSFFTWANHRKPSWYGKRGQYLNDMVIWGAWYTSLQYMAKRKVVGQSNSEGGCTTPINLYASGGVTTAECVDITHFGDSSENYYVTGLYTGSGINLTTGRLVGEDPLATGGHYVSGLDVYGRLALGGGAQTSYNFQGQIDAFSFKTGNFDDFTGLRMQRPEATIGCDSLNELVCHFDRESGSIDFDDEHCCFTGRQELDDEGTEYKAAYWGEIVGIKGSGFFNVSGVFFGKNRQPSLDYFVPERNYISAVVPDGALSGPTTVVGSGLGADAGFEITGCDLTISPPPITIYDSNFPMSGAPNEIITVSGRGLNQITRISLFNSLNEALYLDVTGTNVGTGINFAIPETHKISGKGPDLDYDLLPLVSNIRFSGTTGFYNNSEQIHSFTTGEVFLLNSGIKIISPSSGIYNEQISLSGRFFTGEGLTDTPIFPLFQTGTDIGDQTYSQIYYTHGINTQYIKAVDGQLKGAITGMTTQVPRDIVRGQMGISGSGTDISVISTGVFTPIPTISGIEIKNLKVGSAFRITGLNACYIRPVVGFTGINLQPAYNFSGTSSAGALSLIANTGNAD